MRFLVTAALLAAPPALAQQQDQAKLAPIYQQQRNSALDGVASCALSIADLQRQIADLEKKLAAATTSQENH